MKREPTVRHAFSYSFEQFESDQIEKAIAVLASGASGGWFKGDPRAAKRHLFRWGIIALARAVVKAGTMPLPPAVDMREETREEKAERCGRWQLATTAAPKDSDPCYRIDLSVGPDVEGVFKELANDCFDGNKRGAMEWVLKYVAANLPQFEPSMRKFGRYCNAEGLDQHAELSARVRAVLDRKRLALDGDDDDREGEGWKG